MKMKKCKQFRSFGPNLPKEGNSGRKQKTMNITIEIYIFELVKVPNFNSNR